MQIAMHSRRCFLVALLPIVFLATWLRAADDPQGHPAGIRVLLVTGGHDFERKQFFELFQTNTDISLQTVEHTNLAAFLQAPQAQTYDVLALYDMWQNISDEMKTNFVELLRQGKGLVVLHHALCSYQDWPEYRRIIGGRYLLKKTVLDGVEWPASSYEHGRHFVIHIVDQSHPITQGVRDFEIHDETYKGFNVMADVHPLLTTDDPESTKTIAWTKTYLSARVFFMQSGHDHFAWDNPSYQRILRQGIRWAAGRD
jgi:uncharacterized protein